MTDRGLKTAQEVSVFIEGLKYGAGLWLDKADQAKAIAAPSADDWLQKVFLSVTKGYDAVGLNNLIIAESYNRPALALEAQSPASLSRADFINLLFTVFPGGRAAEDQRDNAIAMAAFEALTQEMEKRERAAAFSGQRLLRP